MLYLTIMESFIVILFIIFMLVAIYLSYAANLDQYKGTSLLVRSYNEVLCSAIMNAFFVVIFHPIFNSLLDVIYFSLLLMLFFYLSIKHINRDFKNNIEESTYWHTKKSITNMKIATAVPLVGISLMKIFLETTYDINLLDIVKQMSMFLLAIGLSWLCSAIYRMLKIKKLERDLGAEIIENIR